MMKKYLLNTQVYSKDQISKSWYKEGKRHRTDGPVREVAAETKEWYFEGKCLSDFDLNNLTAGTSKKLGQQTLDLK